MPSFRDEVRDPTSHEGILSPASGADVPAPRHHRPPDQGQRRRGDHERAVPRVLVGRRAEAGGRLEAPPGVKGDITLIMIGYYDSVLRKIDGVWKLTRLDVKHSLPVFVG